MSTVLWWGRFDPDYSRNHVLRTLFAGHGWVIHDFHPRISGVGDFEATLRGIARPELVWVPCFRQRDLDAAACWAKRQDVPLVFDPLISAYDKQVDERGKLSAGSRGANKLLEKERRQFARATRVVADTPLHADYFADQLGVARDRLAVVYVGAEEALFQSQDAPEPVTGDIPEVLFYGSFIPLQGPRVIIEAARLYNGPPVRWTLIGRGPQHADCVTAAAGLDNVTFEDWLPYAELPARIHRASILLGVFGNTPKAVRVIPNKVFQSLACGRVVITQASAAYPEALLSREDTGLLWVDAGDAHALAQQVARLARDSTRVTRLGRAAANSSREYFSQDVIWRQLSALLQGLSL